MHAIGSSPADSPTTIVGLDADTRNLADDVLITLEAPRVTPQSGVAHLVGAHQVPLISLAAGKQSPRGVCTTLVPTTDGALIATFNLRRGGTSISNLGSAPAAVAFRRFGDAFHPVAPVIASRGVVTLAVATDSAATSWEAQVTSPSAVRACRLTA